MIMMIKFLYWLIATGALVLLSLGVSEDGSSMMMYGRRSAGAISAIGIGAGLLVGILMYFACKRR